MQDTQLKKVALGKRVIYKYPLTSCWKDGQEAIVIDHGEESKMGIPHRICFVEDDVVWDVMPDEITPLEK